MIKMLYVHIRIFLIKLITLYIMIIFFKSFLIAGWIWVYALFNSVCCLSKRTWIQSTLGSQVWWICPCDTVLGEEQPGICLHLADSQASLCSEPQAYEKFYSKIQLDCSWGIIIKAEFLPSSVQIPPTHTLHLSTHRKLPKIVSSI